MFFSKEVSFSFLPLSFSLSRFCLSQHTQIKAMNANAHYPLDHEIHPQYMFGEHLTHTL